MLYIAAGEGLVLGGVPCLLFNRAPRAQTAPVVLLFRGHSAVDGPPAEAVAAAYVNVHGAQVIVLSCNIMLYSILYYNTMC